MATQPAAPGAPAQATACSLRFDGRTLTGPEDQPLIDFLAAQGIDLPHVCYHTALGPLQTCDVCWVEIDGELVRGCTLRSREGLEVRSRGARATAAREEGMDRLLAKHELYCTLCENNTGDCTLHNTFAGMEIPIQRYPFTRKPYAKDDSSPFYTPTSASSAGAVSRHARTSRSTRPSASTIGRRSSTAWCSRAPMARRASRRAHGMECHGIVGMMRARGLERRTREQPPGLLGVYRLLHDEQLWRALTPLIEGLKGFAEGLEKPGSRARSPTSAASRAAPLEMSAASDAHRGAAAPRRGSGFHCDSSRDARVSAATIPVREVAPRSSSNSRRRSNGCGGQQ